MGSFSWLFSDGPNEAGEYNLRIGKAGYLLQPNGNHLFEKEYDVNGVFAGQDVYDLVVDWNREFLNKDMLVKPKKYGNDEYSEKFYQMHYQDYLKDIAVLEKYRDLNVTEEEMEEYCREIDFGYEFNGSREWKRYIGVAIAAYDEQNEKLPFPIKVCAEPQDYNSVSFSKGDPEQGEEPYVETIAKELIDEWNLPKDEAEEIAEYIDKENGESKWVIDILDSYEDVAEKYMDEIPEEDLQEYFQYIIEDAYEDGEWDMESVGSEIVSTEHFKFIELSSGTIIELDCTPSWKER